MVTILPVMYCPVIGNSPLPPLLSPTEQEPGEWVDSFPYLDIYKDYTALENGYEYNLDNAIESLHSRIKSEGFTHPERVVLLTKK